MGVTRSVARDRYYEFRRRRRKSHDAVRGGLGVFGRVHLLTMVGAIATNPWLEVVDLVSGVLTLSL